MDSDPPVIIGCSRHHQTATAVQLASSNIARHRPLLIMVLAGGKHSGPAVVEELQRRFPGTPLVGGSVAGTAARHAVSYSGFEMALVAFMSASFTPKVYSSSESLSDDYEKAKELGQRIRQDSEAGSSIAFFYDSVANAVPRQIHYGSSVASGLQSGLQYSSFECAGAGLLTDFDFDNSWILDGQAFRQHAIAALVYPSNVRMNCSILAGSRPIGIFLEITKIDGAEVQEFNGRPAYQVLCEVLGREPGSSEKVLALNVSLGQSVSPSSGSQGSTAMVNRLILSEDRDSQTVTLFEPDFVLGEQVQILLQDIEFMQEEVRRGILQQIRDIADRHVIFSTYFDCAGRSNILTGSILEEASILMAKLPPEWPAIGFYSGIEVCRVDKSLRALDLTGVLATVYET